MKKIINKNKGITLVALIITIIILLILSGITIATLGGENGLFARVKLGKERYAISEAKEKLELEIANLQIEQQGKGEELKKEDLPKMNSDEIDVRDTTNFPVEVIYKNYKFEVDSNFKVTYVGEANETIITYTTEPEGYTNQNNIKVLVKITNPKGIKSILKPDETDKILPQDRTTAGIEFTVTKNGHYILKVEDVDGNEVSKDIYIDLIDTLAPEEFTPEVQKNGSTITIVENGKDAEATEESSKSGIDHYEYYLIDSSNKETKYDSNKIENLALGTYRAYVIAFDKAGNSRKSNEVEFSITIEFSKISAGDQHNLAIDKEGNLYSWGGSNSTLEDGVTALATGRFENWGPAKMKLDFKIKEMSVGNFEHSLVIDNNGYLWSRARSNSYGQLGNGTTEVSDKLIKIKEDVKFVKISASKYHNLAIDTEGNLWTWGDNEYGQLGDGTTTNKLEPTQIMPNKKFIQIATGVFHSLAIDNDGNLWSWGYNGDKQLGDGTTVERNTPIQILKNEKFIQVSAMENHSLALDSEGNVWRWGESAYDTGTRRYYYKNDPQKIEIDKRITQISAGTYHVLALDSEGNVWRWGLNAAGQLGNGTNKQNDTPTQLVSDKKFIQIAAGDRHSLALDSDGTIWGWGSNNSWELGIGDNRVYSKELPIQIVPASKKN